MSLIVVARAVIPACALSAADDEMREHRRRIKYVTD